MTREFSCPVQYEGKGGKDVLRKIDIRLVPVMALLYLLAHIDRANIGNSKIEGMDKELRLVRNQYNIASTVFFVPYIIFEIPSNMVLKKDFKGLVICRVILGIFEAGFFPGAVFNITNWYKRGEVHQRLALIYTASAFSGAFSGLVAYAIAKMDGARGIPGWQWIFLIEGAVTIAVGLVVPFLIVDNPERTKWLSEDEKAFVHSRLVVDGVISSTEEGDKFSWSLFFDAVFDWKVWAGIVMAWANSVPNAAFKFTMLRSSNSLILRPRGGGQLLTSPPYFCGVEVSVHQRTPDPADNIATMLFGLADRVKQNVGALYFAIVLAQIGTYPLLPCNSAYTGNNLAPSWKRSIGLASTLLAGNFGSSIGTNIFLDKEAPRYQTGYGVSLSFICLGLITAVALEFTLKVKNKKKKTVSEEEVRSHYTDEQLDKLGDKSPLFKYML